MHIHGVVSLLNKVDRGSLNAFEQQENRLYLSIAKNDLDDVLSSIEGGQMVEAAAELSRLGRSMQSQLGALYFLLWTRKLQAKIYGEGHMEIARTLNQIGIVYFTMGTVVDLGRAEFSFQESLRIKRRLVGDTDHSEIATSINNIALVFRERKDYDRALTLFRKSLRMKRSTVGDNSPKVALTIVNIANIYELKGNLNKALVLYRKALPVQKMALEQ